MTAVPDPQETLRRRLKAARALAGLTVEELAREVGQTGYGAKTLYAMESETGREILPKDHAILAEACGLPREFFTMDFHVHEAHLGMDDIRARMEANDERAAQMAAEVAQMQAQLIEITAARLRNATELAELRNTRRRKPPTADAQ